MQVWDRSSPAIIILKTQGFHFSSIRGTISPQNMFGRDLQAQETQVAQHFQILGVKEAVSVRPWISSALCPCTLWIASDSLEWSLNPSVF